MATAIGAPIPDSSLDRLLKLLHEDWFDVKNLPKNFSSFKKARSLIPEQLPVFESPARVNLGDDEEKTDNFVHFRIADIIKNAFADPIVGSDDSVCRAAKHHF